MRGLVQSYLNILNKVLKFNKNFNYFIQDRGLKYGVEGGGSPSQSKKILNFKLIGLIITFVSHSHI